MEAVLKKRKKYRLGDFAILSLTACISLFGVLMQFSASYYTAMSDPRINDSLHYLKSSAMWFALGWAVFIFAALFDYHWLGPLAIPALVVGFGLLGAIFTPLGTELNNATRWIEIGPISLMPGEIMKTCCILFFAWLFAAHPGYIKNKKYILLSIVIIGAAVFLIYEQPNLSTALTLGMLCLGIMFLAGLSWRSIALFFGIGAAGVTGLLILKPGYMTERFENFWDPFSDSLGKGYQVCQGLMAIGSGGFFGVGLGNSIQKAYYLPEAESDFILPIIGEELGFFGILVLMTAYLGLCFAVFNVALHAKDRFGFLLAGGVGLHLGLQVLMNIAVVTASMPPTGIALPMVSMGGNSTLLFLGELGIVYNISRQSRES